MVDLFYSNTQFQRKGITLWGIFGGKEVVSENFSSKPKIYIYTYKLKTISMFEGKLKKSLKSLLSNLNRVSNKLSCSVMSDSLGLHGLSPARLFCPWDSPGKNTGVGCHSLLQGILPTQESKPGLLHFRQILYHQSQEISKKWLVQECRRSKKKKKCRRYGTKLVRITEIIYIGD